MGVTLSGIRARFRRFYKMILKKKIRILKLFITCIAFAYKADMTLMQILLVLIGETWIQLLLGLRKTKGIVKTVLLVWKETSFSCSTNE